MKNKIISIILFLVLVVSIVGNVYQFNISKDINGNISSYTTELSGLNDNIDSLNNDITAKDNELAALSTKVTELESSIQTVQTENDSLSAQIADLEKKKEESLKTSVASVDNNSEDVTFDSAMAQAAQALLDDYNKNNPGGGSTTIDGGSSTPATGPSDMEFPEGPSYEPDGIICY